MRILEDGSVEIRSNKGNVKIVKPEELPSYGIPYTDYQTQLEAYKVAVKGEGTKEEKKVAEEKSKGLAQKQEVLGVVNQLMGRNTDPITGTTGLGRDPFKIAQIFGGRGKTENLYNQLQALLSLENVGKLKGTGAISDFESRLLSQAASALGTNLSNKDFRDTLAEVQRSLSGETTDVSPEDEDLIKKYKNYGK